jgi:UDP:flavonoid glycosyltransferase YjiC (YdhE family)
VLMPNTYLLPAPGMPPMGLGLRPARGVVGRVRDRAISAVTMRAWDRKGLPRLNELRATYGLEPLTHFWDQVHRAGAEIVLTSPSFDFPARLPANVRYVGPVLDDAGWCEPWEPPPGDRPLVLVAMSSTYQDQTDTVQRVVDALATLPVRGLVTTGPALDPASITPRGDITIVRSAPHRAVLRHAAVVVNHGGHGTVVKALAEGVPMLILPHGRDQADNAARVVSRGAGLSLKRNASAARIAKAVRQLLEGHHFGHAARTLGESICCDTPPDELARVLQDIPQRCVSA